MTNVIIAIHVQNAFNFPKEAEAFAIEQQRMSSNLEDGPSFTEEEQFLVTALEGDCPALDMDSQKEWVKKTMTTLSEDFPNLIFAVDIKAQEADGEPGALIRREYFEGGERQVVFPYTVVPDFDPEGEFD